MASHVKFLTAVVRKIRTKLQESVKPFIPTICIYLLNNPIRYFLCKFLHSVIVVPKKHRPTNSRECAKMSLDTGGASLSSLNYSSELLLRMTFHCWFWNLKFQCIRWDRLCGLVVRVSGYRYRGLGFDSRRYQIF